MMSDCPCNGLCIPDPKWGKYCVTCYLWVHEVQHWDMYNPEQQALIVQRINDLKKEDPKEYPDYK